MNEAVAITVRFSKITACRHSLPDFGKEVLVYDSSLDDVLIACLRQSDISEMVFEESITGNVLPSPAWWAEKPYPEENRERKYLEQDGIDQ